MKVTTKNPGNIVDFTFAHCKEGFDNHINLSIRGYNDLLDDIVHELEHAVEKKYGDFIYGERKIEDELILKRNQLKKFIFSAGFKKSQKI